MCKEHEDFGLCNYIEKKGEKNSKRNFRIYKGNQMSIHTCYYMIKNLLTSAFGAISKYFDLFHPYIYSMPSPLVPGNN